jgi:hypothetical protein
MGQADSKLNLLGKFECASIKNPVPNFMKVYEMEIKHTE